MFTLTNNIQEQSSTWSSSYLVDKTLPRDVFWQNLPTSQNKRNFQDAP